MGEIKALKYAKGYEESRKEFMENDISMMFKWLLVCDRYGVIVPEQAKKDFFQRLQREPYKDMDRVKFHGIFKQATLTAEKALKNNQSIKSRLKDFYESHKLRSSVVIH